MNRREWRGLVGVFLSALLGTGTAGAQPVAADALKALKWRFIGPLGNRVIAVAGVPGDPNVYYVGAASGGLFKTSDAGTTWIPLFDDQDVSSVSALAVAPSDPNVVWVGTGETFIRSNVSLGNGVYRSTDAGRTFDKVGLEKTGRVARIVVDARDPDIALVCALGHSYGPQPERGVFRTTDAGKTWQRSLFVDENTGCSDLAMDPKNPRIVYAGMWPLEIHTWGRTSGGAGGGLYLSRDGGVNFRKLTGKGLPTEPLGKVAVAIAQSNPNRVYALIETGDGVPFSGWKDHKGQSGQLWRTSDGGDTWQVMSHDRQLRGRTHFYNRHAVAPDNENEVYFLTAAYARTLDGGTTILDVKDAEAPGGDHHDMWIDPQDANRQAVAHDGGLSLSVNRGRTWNRIQLPVAQMYHVAVDNRIPYYVYGNQQDGPSHRGPSHSRLGPGFGGDGPGPIPRGMWHQVAGGESGWVVPDLVDPNIVWSSGTGYGSLGGTVERFDLRTMQARRVEVWPDLTIGWPAADLKYRFNWTFPLFISPHDHDTVYTASQVVHRTTNAGQSWEVVSPDLTRNDKSRQQISGGLTPDNIGVEYAGVVFALAESPLEKGLLWAGTNDGLVQLTRDAGRTWSNVTANLPGLPPWGTVSNIEPSRHAPGAAYLTVDFHQVNNREPFVYKTTDYGKTWKSVVGDLPRGLLSYAHCVREDPVRPGLLYLGTENRVYVTWNDGMNWTPLMSGLPPAPAHWLVVQEHFADLVVGTYGRGFYVLDDITPLRQVSPEAMAGPVHLFKPRPAYRFRPIVEPAMTQGDPSVGKNPPDGALVHYFLKAASTGDVKVAILDAAGKAVRTFDGTKDAGINRVYWDLRYDKTREIKLRTSPPFAPETKVGPEGFRPFPLGGRLSVLAPPGTYTVKLSVDGKDYTQSLTVLKDPNTAGSEADIAAQTKVVMEVRERLEQAAEAINQIELVRAQILGVKGLAGDAAEAKAVVAAGDELDRKLVALEEGLFQMKVTGRGQDLLRYPSQLVEKLVYSVDGLTVSDFPPTNEQLAVHALLNERLQAIRAGLSELLKTDVAAYAEKVRQSGLGGIASRMP